MIFSPPSSFLAVKRIFPSSGVFSMAFFNKPSQTFWRTIRSIYRERLSSNSRKRVNALSPMADCAWSHISSNIGLTGISSMIASSPSKRDSSRLDICSITSAYCFWSSPSSQTKEAALSTISKIFCFSSTERWSKISSIFSWRSMSFLRLRCPRSSVLSNPGMFASPLFL